MQAAVVHSVFLVFMVGAYTSAQGKGLDQLKPDPKGQASETTAAQAKDADQEKAADKATEKPAEESKTEPKPVMQKSAFSKKMADKLFLSTGAGFVSVRADGDDWRAFMMGDIGIGYFLKDPGQKFAYAWTFRYAPIDVSPKVKNQEYRGVIDSYHFGALTHFRHSDSLKWIATAELAMMFTFLNSSDTFDQDEDTEKNGVNVFVGGGADWRFWDKMAFGPRLHLGFGRFTTFQALGSLSFVF